MSTPDRDEEFEAFLARRSLLPRALAEHEDAEPRPEVDRSVLYEAQAAVNAAPARKSFRKNRWPVPVALAATVLISLAIVVQLQRPAPDTFAFSRGAQPGSTQQRQAFEPGVPAVQPDLAPEPESDGAEFSDSPERFAKASAPAESRALIASANQMRPTAEERADEAADVDASADAAVASRREAVAASPPTPSPAPVLADAARARDNAAAEADRAATNSVAATEARGTTDSVAEAKARSATDSVATAEAENGKAAPAAAASAERDPKAWLERIAKLRAEGKRAQADREFKAFVKRYPDYVTDEAAK
jgi:hypothetical protein